jgi:hypothetical protein
METTVRNVIDGNLSIRGVSELYDLPYNTQRGKLKNKKVFAAELNRRIRGRIGHPTVLSPEEKEALFRRILFLEHKVLVLTSIQTRRGVFSLAEMTKIKHSWNTVIRLQK